MCSLRITKGLAIVGLALLLSACGQKGDLYLPEAEKAYTSHF